MMSKTDVNYLQLIIVTKLVSPDVSNSRMMDRRTPRDLTPNHDEETFFKYNELPGGHIKRFT